MSKTVVPIGTAVFVFAITTLFAPAPYLCDGMCFFYADKITMTRNNTKKHVLKLAIFSYIFRKFAYEIEKAPASAGALNDV